MCPRTKATDVSEIQNGKELYYLNGLFAIGEETYMLVPPVRIYVLINNMLVSFEVIMFIFVHILN